MITKKRLGEIKSGTELDALIAEKVMGFKKYYAWVFDGQLCSSGRWLDDCGHFEFVDDKNQIISIPNYSTSIEAAFTVVDLMRDRGFRFDLIIGVADRHSIASFSNALGKIYYADRGNATNIICLVALKAVGYKESK